MPQITRLHAPRRLGMIHIPHPRGDIAIGVHLSHIWRCTSRCEFPSLTSQIPVGSYNAPGKPTVYPYFLKWPSRAAASLCARGCALWSGPQGTSATVCAARGICDAATKRDACTSTRLSWMLPLLQRPAGPAAFRRCNKLAQPAPGSPFSSASLSQVFPQCGRWPALC